MSCPDYADAIGDYVDGALAGPARVRLESHLSACAACRDTADDFRRIREAARALPARVAPAGAWPRIAGRLRAEGAAPGGRQPAPRGMLSGLDWRHLAAAAALALAVASVTWYARGALGPLDPAGAPGLVGAGGDIETELRLAEEHYERAIRSLEQIASLEEEEEPLDPEVADTLRHTMAVIDQAITESRAALRIEPASRVARESLFEALRRKVSLLQDTIALVNEMRKGDPAGAARIAEGLDPS